MKWIVILISVYLIACFVKSMHRTDECIERSRIVSVGGCDMYANCGVSLENGEGVIDNFPKIGQFICVAHKKFEWIWLWGDE